MRKLSDDTSLYTLRSAIGTDLPVWEAGAHIDVVIAPDKLRQFSLLSDPGDRLQFQIAVQREPKGRGGSLLLHRIFAEGRRVFVSKPINHFPLAASGARSFLMGGGIGITPMMAMAHALFRQGAAFDLHYSIKTRGAGAFVDMLSQMPWAEHVHVHVSDEGTRVDLPQILSGYRPGVQVYTCGPDAYMTAVLGAAEAAGFPQMACHSEYFTVPEQPEYLNTPFTLVLPDGRRIAVSAGQSAAEALIANGVSVDLKCSDGLCGVCKCGVISGEVEHRDFILSQEQRQTQMILCQSRAREAGGEIAIDL